MNEVIHKHAYMHIATQWGKISSFCQQLNLSLLPCHQLKSAGLLHYEVVGFYPTGSDTLST